MVQILSLGFISAGPIHWASGLKSKAEAFQAAAGGQNISYADAMNNTILNNAVHDSVYIAWLSASQLNVMFSVHFSLLATTWSTLRETRSAIQSNAMSPQRSSEEAIHKKVVNKQPKQQRAVENKPPIDSIVAPSPLFQRRQEQQRTLLSYITDAEPMEVMRSMTEGVNDEDEEEEEEKEAWRSRKGPGGEKTDNR